MDRTSSESFPLAERHAIERWRFVWIKFDEVADEQIEMTVAVVVEERAARSPASFFLVQAGFARGIGECAVSIVMEEDVAPPERAEQVVPSVVVVVAYANAGLPAGAANSGLLSDVSECAVAIVFIQVGGGYLAGAQCASSRLPLVR